MCNGGVTGAGGVNMDRLSICTFPSSRTFECQHQRYAFVAPFKPHAFLRRLVGSGVGVFLGQSKVHDGHVGAEPTTQVDIT